MIDDLFRKYSVKVNTGSGCLYQPDTKAYTYVLTAKHCICKDKKILSKEDIKVYNGNEILEANRLEIREVHYNRKEDTDAAILKISYLKDNIRLYHTSCARTDQLTFFGFPKRRAKKRFKTAAVNCTVNLTEEDGSIEIIPDKTQFTYDNSAKETLGGFSGGGVFREIGNNILLVGIVSELADETGAGDEIVILSMKYFTDIITTEKGLAPLTTAHIASFNVYKGQIWNSINPKRVGKILDNESDKIIKHNITPLLVMDVFDEELFIGNNSDCKSDFALWVGWLEFLVYCNLITPKSIPGKEEKLRNLLIGRKFIYSGVENDWAIIIKGLLKEFRHVLKAEDKVIINSKGPVFTRKLKPDAVKNILQSIDDAIVYEAEGIIDRVKNLHEDITYIHISEFREKIGQNQRLASGLVKQRSEIIQELKNCVLEAFND